MSVWSLSNMHNNLARDGSDAMLVRCSVTHKAVDVKDERILWEFEKRHAPIDGAS